MQTPEKTRPLFDNPHTHNILEGGRGGGKSITAASLIAKVMEKQPLRVICGREVQKSIKESSYAELEAAIRTNCDPSQFDFTPSQLTITSKCGGRAVFIGLLHHTVDSIKSFKDYHWAWIEEAQSVSKKSLEVLIPTLRTDGWIGVNFGDGLERKFPLRMFIYTENPYTWDDPINIVLPASRDDVQRIKINHDDNPWFPESLEKERLQEKAHMHPDEYLRIWEGIPYEDAERSIIPRVKVLEAMKRKASRDGGKVTGADIARFGSDRTQFYKREGLQVIDEKTYTKKDTQEVARNLIVFGEGGKLMVDDTGVGGGVTDKARDLGGNVVPINFGGRPKNKKKYPDIISEMWFELADQIDKIGLPDDMELLTELTSRHYKYTSDERRKVESKEDYRKRTGRRSPDKADALILCYYNRGGSMSVVNL